MRTTTQLLVTLALAGLASATINPKPHVVADKEFLTRQQKLLQVFLHIGQPSLDPAHQEISKTFKLEDHANDFKDPEIVKKFLKYYNRGYYKQRGEDFSIYEKYDQIQAKVLVDILYQAKDFDTFFKTAVWAKDNLNEGLFAYAVNVARLHREDLFDVVLPPAYELYPELFVSHEVIKEAWEASLEGKASNKDKPYVIQVNYSGQPYAHNADDLVSYYTEDVGLNAYLAFVHYRYPFWAKMDEYNQANYTRRGDHFYYGIKAILGRYYLERLSNHLPDIEPIDYTRPIQGVLPYGPYAKYLSVLERRLEESIDVGYVIDSNLTKHSLRDPLSIEIFGRIVEGNADSINKDLYGSFYNSLLTFVGKAVDPAHHHIAKTSDLELPAAAFRAPLYYKIAKRVGVIFDHFKEHLGSYPQEQLLLPGVKVESLDVDKFVTYFKKFEFSLNNAIPVSSLEEASKLNVVARTQRLTHKPFNYRIKVSSDKDIDVFVRFFIGPRYDVYGKELSLNEKKDNMVYTDSFVYKLKKGENELLRNSKLFNYYGQVPLSFSELYSKTEAALKGGSEIYVDDFVNKFGDSDGLALPRGTRNGLPLSAYVIITPSTHTTISRVSPNTDDVGAKISFFPFDRPINDIEFNVPNSRFTDAVVVHRSEDEVGIA